jgi:hypothetical protein
VCYDDLDPGALNGAIAFHARGYAALWEHCRRTGLEVVADVHTHPGSNTGQSHIDQRNPMVPSIGHMGLIVPNFAATAWWSLRGVGVHEYLGNFEWRRHDRDGLSDRVNLTLW